MDKPSPVVAATPMPPVRTPLDLQMHWRRLLMPLALDERVLWVTVLGRGGRPLPVLPRVEQLPAMPDPRVLTHMMRGLAEGLGHPAEGLSVAFLIARPGRPGATHSDEAWMTLLHDEAARLGMRMWPTHLATIAGVVPLDTVETGPSAA